MLYAVRYALLPFVVALAIAFVVEPIVGGLQRRFGGRRWAAALVAYLALLAAFAAAAYWIGSAAAADLGSFLRHLPVVMHDLAAAVIGPQGGEFFGQTVTPDTVVRQLGDWVGGVLGVGAAVKAAALGAALLLGGFLTLVLLGFFLISGPRLASGAVWLVPPERRASVERLLPRIVPALRRYLVGVLAVVLYTGAVAWIGFGPVFHLPHAVVLAIAVGILETVPVAGPGAAAVLVGVTALQQHTVAAMLTLIGFVILLRLSIDNLVGPIVLGQAARLHPVVVIFSFIVGAMLFGIIGLILAVPVAVSIKIVLQHYYSERVAERDRDLRPPAPRSEP